MPDRVDRPTIKREVIAKLNAVAEPQPPLNPTSTPDEKKLLLDDLGMGPTFRRAMALPYTKISLRHGGKPVTQSAAQDLNSVGDSIDLVFKQANA
jgi:hypothetical protein